LFANKQIGIIQASVKPKKNYYVLKLVDSGSIVTAIPLQQSRGAATRFAVGDSVLASYAAGAWFIDGLIPKIVLDENSSPRLQSLAPGDCFYGNAATSAGMHVTGGLTTIEAGGVDGSGKPRRAAATMWVPDSDAIMNLCRRFGLKGAPGDIQMLHDDLTGETALRMWVRGSSMTGLDGRTTRIHMGYHRDPVGATFSITTFPAGPEPAIPKVPEFKMDPEAEIHPFAGQWPTVERRDWNSRIYALLDGTLIYENASVPAPSLVPTTAAQTTNKIIISPEGIVSFVGTHTDISVEALSSVLSFSASYFMKTPLLDIDTQNARIGKLEEVLTVTNSKFFEHVNKLIELYNNHVHLGVQTGPGATPPTASISEPATFDMLTHEVKLS